MPEYINVTEIIAKKGKTLMAYQAKELLSILVISFIVQLTFLVFFNFITKRRLLQNVGIIAITSYTIVVINLTMLPIIMNQPAISWSEVPYNLMPFDSIVGSLNHYYYVVPLRNIIGNIVLLLPLALFLNIKRWIRAVIIGFSISLIIEIAQLITAKIGYSYRSFDVDDLILNTTGFFVGYILRCGVTLMIEKLKAKKLRGFGRQ